MLLTVTLSQNAAQNCGIIGSARGKTLPEDEKSKTKSNEIKEVIL